MRKMGRLMSLLLAFSLCVLALGSTAFGEAGDMSGKIVLLYTANVRGQIDLYPQIAALRDSYQARGANVLLVDAGNYLQGTVYATYDSGKSVVELMSAAGYDAAAIGSHEFDFGTGTVGVERHEVYYADESFGKLLESAGFVATAANILTGEGGDVNAYAPSVERNWGGQTVRIVGLTDPETVNRALDSSLEGLAFADPVSALEKEAEGAFLVALSNAGTLPEDAADVVIDIPEHAGLTVGRAVIDGATMTLEDTRTLQLSGEENADVRAVVERVKVQVDAEYGFEDIAKAAVELNGATKDVRSMETNLGNLWTDALLWFATQGGIENFYDQDEIDNGNTGIQVDSRHIVALWNGGNLRDFLHTGDVTRKDLQRVLPYPNKVAVLYLTGAELLEQLEAATFALPYTEETSAALASFPQVAGLCYSVESGAAYDAGEAYNDQWFVANSVNRVQIESVHGSEFDPEAVYAVITSNAIFNGMDAYYVSQEKDEEWSTITSAAVVDVVWMYIHEELGGVVGEQYAQTEGRIAIR